MKNFYFILLAILEYLSTSILLAILEYLSTAHMIFWRFFAQQVSAENEVSFHH